LRTFLSALAVAALAASGAQAVSLLGVLEGVGHYAKVESVSVVVGGVPEMHGTAGWEADTAMTDTFAFPEMQSWPTSMKAFVLTDTSRLMRVLRADTLVEDSWYTLPGPQQPRLKMVTAPTGLDARPEQTSPSRVAVWPSVGAGAVTISARGPFAGPARFEVYDAAGNIVRVLSVPGTGAAIVWPGDDNAGRRVAAGLYFVRLISGSGSAMAKVVLAD
jgi:hypothetical protein